MKKILPILMLAILMALPMKSAFAASVTISVQQVNPTGATKTVTCASSCTLPLTINAGTPTAQSLNIQASFNSSALAFMFQTSTGNILAGNTGDGSFYDTLNEQIPTNNSPATYMVSLTQMVTNKGGSAMVKLTPAPPSVADLEITITPVQ